MKKKKTKKKKVKKNAKRFRLQRRFVKEIYEQIQTLAPLVLRILEKDKLTRDDDNRLCIQVWKHQGMKLNKTFKHFSYHLILNKLTTPESITRTRRAIQSTPGYEYLQGTIYEKRKAAEAKLRNQLSFNF